MKPEEIAALKEQLKADPELLKQLTESPEGDKKNPADSDIEIDGHKYTPEEYKKHREILDEMKKKDARLKDLLDKEAKEKEKASKIAEEEAKKKGEFENLYNSTKSQFDEAKKELEVLKEKIESERQELLKKLPINKQEIFKDLSKEQLTALLNDLNVEGSPSSPGQHQKSNGGITTLKNLTDEQKAQLYKDNPKLFYELEKKDKGQSWL